jgi:2-polyprenyl-6-methoxyphenol hydroxylase-like FAD-dependent oxidoreductase
MARLCPLERVLAAGAPPGPRIILGAEGVSTNLTFSAVEGIDYGMNTRRPELDLALVETARAAGVEVRERCRVTEGIWRGNRLAGLRYRSTDGASHEVLAKLTVGADGRYSTIAELVGAAKYKTLPNGRGLAFHYMADTLEGAQYEPRSDAICKWRHGLIDSFFFPNNNDSFTALLMCPVADTERHLAQPETWDKVVADQPELAERIGAARPEGRIRGATDTEAYFRVSAGPGWALVGDAGSWKDPIIAQGIREALRTGRLLGENVAAVLDDPAATDRATRACERLRDAEVLPTYYWAYKQSRAIPTSAVEAEFLADAAGNPALARAVGDTFSRLISPQRSLPLHRAVVWTVRALRRPGADRPAIAKFVAAELRLELALVRDKLFVKAGHRPPGTVRDRFVGAYWTPHMALGQHKPSSPPFLPETDRTAAPVRSRRPAKTT